MFNKTVRFFGRSTTSATETLADGLETSLWGEYSHMDAIAIVSSITAAKNIWITIQEKFPYGDGTSVFQTTASITAGVAGTYYFTPNANGYSGSSQNNPMLGKGAAKQVVLSCTNGSQKGVVDMVFIFYNSS